MAILLDLYEKILVATDGSEHAKHVLNTAVETASKWGAELLIITVVPPGSPALYRSETRAYHQHVLKDAAEAVVNKNPDIKFFTRLVEGSPSTMIVKIAEDEDADLIVMGSRGLGGITGLLLGSTSRHVVETCTKPILIIK
jgi:nucleotide-binding universal stress UspA family protein